MPIQDYTQCYENVEVQRLGGSWGSDLR